MKRSWPLHFLISAFLLAGCAPSAPTIQPTKGTQIPSPTISLATTTTIPTWTMTIAITDTETPMPTLTGTLTPTPVETMEPTQAMETIQPLLKDPLNCAIPCFWGITPGKTSLDEVRLFFSRLGFIPFEGTDQNTSLYFYTISYASTMGHDSSVTFFFSNNQLTNIFVTPYIVKQEGTPRKWIAYSPETMIKKFGKPSKVFLNIYRGQYRSNTITMLLYFDDVDFITLYQGDNMVPAQPHSPLFCPLTASFDQIRFWMGANPPNPPVIDNGYDITEKYLPLEEVTSLTIDQFTQLMLSDPQQACFTLNGDMFPN
jgi:hypothetical protein